MMDVNKIIEELGIKDAKYYDIINDKAQGNSNYYKIIHIYKYFRHNLRSVST